MTHSAYHVTPTTFIKSYRRLGAYTKKDISAWTEVSTIPCPPMAPITAPGGRDLGDFGASGRAGDIHNSISITN